MKTTLKAFDMSLKNLQLHYKDLINISMKATTQAIFVGNLFGRMNDKDDFYKGLY